MPETCNQLTLKSVFEQIGESHELSKKQSHEIAANLVEAVTTILKNGDRIRMSGIGILEVKERAARSGRNPATGQTIQIAASRKIAFRPSKELKELV